MHEWKRVLKGLIDSADKGKIVIVGVGNVLRGDDGAGILFVRKLRSRALPDRVSVIEAGERVEAAFDLVKRFNPVLVLLVDAVRFGGEPGEIRVLSIEEIEDLYAYTHRVPLPMILKAMELDFDVYVIGIEPKSIEFGGSVSYEVERAVENLCSFFVELFG